MKKSYLYKALLISLLSFLIISSKNYAQQSSTIYLMHDVPQTNLLNPAVQINCKWFVSIPLLGSTHFDYSNTAFSFNEIFSTSGGSASLDMGNLYESVKNTNLISTDLHLELLTIGYRRNEYYFNFNIVEKVNVALTYPGSLLEFAWKGNTQYLGETAEFNNLRTHSEHYREYSLGVSKVWDAYSILGLRAKLLFGKANIYSGKSEIGLFTDPNTFNLHVEGEIYENISFPITITTNSDGRINGSEMGSIDLVSYLLNSANKGFAIDLGWIYRYDDKTVLSASLLDLGFIKWKSDVSNLSISGSFDYAGINAGSNFSNTDLAALGDSIVDAYDQTITQEGYYSWLPTQIYLGGMYQYHPKLGIGVVNRNIIYRNKLHSSLTLSANTTLWKKFSASLSWSYLNNTYKNIGLGLAWHSRGLQFHLVSDNLLGIIKPMDTRNLNLRFGFGVLFGCPKNKEEELKMSNDFEPMLDGNCYWAKKMDKNYKKVRKKKEKRKR